MSKELRYLATVLVGFVLLIGAVDGICSALGL